MEIYHLSQPCKYRGLALIINNNFMFDADHSVRKPPSLYDCNKLQLLLNNLGFKTVLIQNISKKDTIDVLRRFSMDPLHGDVMVLAMISHGSDNMRIQTADKEFLEIQTQILPLGIVFQNSCHYNPD